MAENLGEALFSRRAMMVGSLAAAAASAARAESSTTAGGADPVIELRQYKINHGRRDDFVALFEREFVDPQESLGVRLVGQFRDADDPDRFTWIREYPTMAGRAGILTEFYTGPTWLAHRIEANSMLDDNDNVLLLKPSQPGLGFPSIERRPHHPSERGEIVATIHYLWKVPTEGFGPFFEGSGRSALARAGARVLGSYVADARPNEFPRLPVRQGDKVFVWFTRVGDMGIYELAMKEFRGTSGARRGLGWLLPDLEERPAQVLRLRSTPRSRL